MRIVSRSGIALPVIGILALSNVALVIQVSCPFVASAICSATCICRWTGDVKSISLMRFTTCRIN